MYEYVVCGGGRCHVRVVVLDSFDNCDPGDRIDDADVDEEVSRRGTGLFCSLDLEFSKCP